MATNNKPVATIESIEDYLYELGPVDKDDKVTFRGIDFEIVKSLKGKSKLVLNELRGENVVIWWDLNLSQNNLSGEVEIELVGKGPQIKLIPVNE